jgi:RNA-directed DNA polymerase
MGKPAATDRPHLTSLSHSFTLDLVICCRGDAQKALIAMRQMMGRLKLTVNEEKTRICRLPDGEFDFLGYAFGRRYSAKIRRTYIASRPSRKSIKRMTEVVRIQTGRNMEWLDAGEMITCLNQKLGGWANYFKLSPVTPAYRFLDRYATNRLRRWFCKKHKQSGKGMMRYPDEFFYQQLGHPSANASEEPSVGEDMMFCPRAGCVSRACPVR